MANARRLDDAHEHAGTVERTHQHGFVTASGFKDHMHFGSRPRRLLGRGEEFQDAGVILGLVGEVVDSVAQI